MRTCNIMCLYPKLIKKTGKYKEDNYRGLAGTNYSISTYGDCCGCAQCQAKRSNNWVVRNWYESKSHDRKCFITLTYAKQPFFLVRKDMQDFMKRFRYEINKEYLEGLKKEKRRLSHLKGRIIYEEKIEKWKEDHKELYTKVRFFYSGEYGTKGRPHFHLIIYGWDDPKAYFIGVNKKINAIYESETIKKSWGLGRTSYQDFGDFQATYISLYATPKETFKKAYKLTKEKCNHIREIVDKKIDYYSSGQRVNLLNELDYYKKLLEDEKKKYILLREFNGWSISMGWEEFFKSYEKDNKYTFIEYIYDKEYATCSSWLKKLANKYGDIAAAEELFKREKEQYKSASEEEERRRNQGREQAKKVKEIKEYINGKNIETEF